MTSSVAWFDIAEGDAAAATRLYEAALRARLSPAVSVGLTRCVFRMPSAAPPFAARWRRPGRRPHLREAA